MSSHTLQGRNAACPSFTAGVPRVAPESRRVRKRVDTENSTQPCLHIGELCAIGTWVGRAEFLGSHP